MVTVVGSIAITTTANADIHSKPIIRRENGEMAMNEFMAQTRLQVLYDSAVDGISTRPVGGTLEAVEALREMLNSTNLEVIVIDNMTLAVRQPNISSAAPLVSLELVKIEADRISVPRFSSQYQPVSDVKPLRSSGNFTLNEALRNFDQVAGGDCQDMLYTVSRVGQTNSVRGCGINWRYYGAESLLVLLDGMRMPGSGTYGLFSDTFHLPLFLLSGVNPLFDHSSTQYGNDGISGTLNFRLSMCADGSDLRVQVAPGIGHSVGEQQYSYRICHSLGALRATFGFERLVQSRLPAEWRTQATSDRTRWEGPNNDTYFGGTIVDGARTWAIPGHPFTVNELAEGTANLYDTLHHIDLSPEQNIWTLFGAAELPIFNDSTLSTYALYSYRDANATLPALGVELGVPPQNPWYQNPTGHSGNVYVMYGFQNGMGFPVQMDNVVDRTFGLKAHRDVGSWNEVIALGYADQRGIEELNRYVMPTALATALSSNNVATAVDVFGDETSRSTWDGISAQSRFTAWSAVKSVDLSAAGTIYQISAGDVTSHSGLSYRAESLSTYQHQDEYPPDVATSAQRRVVSAFEEVCLPLIGDVGRRCDDPDLSESDLRATFGGRYEHYDDFGGETEPSVQIVWLPLSRLTLNAMWTEAMKPPGLRDVNESQNSSQVVGLRSSPNSSELVPALLWTGGNAGLRPQRAKNFSASATLRSGDDERLKIQIYYFDMRETHRIERPIIDSLTLSSPSLRGLVTLSPTVTERQDMCARSQFVGVAGDCLTAPIAAVVDGRLGNLFDIHTRGFDFDARKRVGSQRNGLTAGISGTYFLMYDSSQFGYRQDLLNTPDNPIKIRGHGFVSWNRNDMEVTTSAFYSGGYRDMTSGYQRHVASWTTYNVQVSESFDERSAYGLSGVTFIFSAENIFDSMPPFVEDPSGFAFDVVNGNLRGRSIRFTVAKHW